jgi:hypothetical protein
MMANVATSLVGGNLTLTDNGAVSFAISQSAANKITLTPAAGTTINGQARAVTINGVTGNLTANLGTGNDTVTFDLSAAGIDVGNLTLNGTTGNKTVQATTGGQDNFLHVHGNFKQVFGNGQEFTRLNQFDVSGNMTIDHANGGSFVFLGVDSTNLGTQFNHVGGNLTVDNVTSSGQAASGFDVNALEETNVGGRVRANMGRGDESGGSNNGVGGWTSVGSQSGNSIAVGGDVKLTAQTGFLSFGDFANDGLEVVNAEVAGDVTMDLGKGIGNTARFGGGNTDDSTTAGSLSITSQGAHAGVTIGASMLSGDLDVSLNGRGSNTIAVDSVFAQGDTHFFAAGNGNEIAIDDQAPGSRFADAVDILMTGNNNLLSINSKHRTPKTGTMTFDGKVTAKLGGSRNTLILAEIGNVEFGAQAKFNGGQGKNNTALVNDGNIVGTDPTIVNFS